MNKKGFDSMGQPLDAKKEDTFKAVEIAPDVPEGENQDAVNVTDRQYILDAIRSDPSLMQEIGTEARLEKERPKGIWKRNYDGEEALRVHGGVEVRHSDDFEPRPPSKIKCYVSLIGGTTDHIKDAEMDSDGKPIKTERYKMWMDAKLASGRFDSDVQNDMDASGVIASEAGVLR